MQLPLSYRALTPELSRKHTFVSANLLGENGLEYIKGSNLQESSSKQSHSDALTIFFMWAKKKQKTETIDKNAPTTKLCSAQLENTFCLLWSYLRAHDKMLQQTDIDMGMTILLFHQGTLAALRQACHTNKYLNDQCFMQICCIDNNYP